MFDSVVVAVLENPAKIPLFSLAERVDLLRLSICGPGVEVMTFSGLTVDCARHVGATALIRGLRMISDFESEFQMALMNRRLAPSVSTVFLMTDFANIFVSSSLLKEACRGGGDVEGLVPPMVLAALRRRFGFAD